MTTTTAQPWTAEQRKLLCKLLRDRGLWDDRHALCGVSSLSVLTRDQASRIIDRLVKDQPQRSRAAYGRRGHRALKPGEIRLAGDATSRQRDTLRYLLLDRCRHVVHDPAGWLLARYRLHLDQLDTEPLPRATASAIINALDRIAEKHGDAQDQDCDAGPAPVAEEIPF